ncbi:hypothetical protein SNE40_019170 [Patella caerulea]|uniref:EF-hand domain-containing protein n=1 Tax=Patella caerulea TaxID=87958 RepID=A0AAN8PI04_PATCE
MLPRRRFTLYTNCFVGNTNRTICCKGQRAATVLNIKANTADNQDNNGEVLRVVRNIRSAPPRFRADVTEITGKRKKSFSNPETIENFQREKHVRLEEEIKLKHLEQLMEEFDIHDPEDIWVPAESGYFPPKLVKRIPGCMNVTEFQETIAKVLGTNEYDDYLGKLFTKLDTSCDGYVDWNEFCTYMLLLYRENDYLRSKKEIPFLQEPKIRHIVQNRQEQTTKMIAIDNPTKFVTISREGIMSVWNPNMQFERSYNVSEDDDESQKRRFKMWVTDAVYMQNCHKLAICSTSRDIRFYDVSATSFFEEFHLFAMTDVPYCLDYWYDVKNPSAESLLIFGLDSGDISLLHFKRPLTQLFETPFLSEGGAQKIFIKDLPQHSKWVTHKVLQKIHPEIIRQVRYIPDSDAIISSSGCSRSAVVIADVCGLKKNYVFRIEKGVECFDHNRNLNILVTGSIDHYIRVWNPYVTSKPTAILTGHSTGVIGVTIHEEFSQVFSYSKDAVIKVWDVKEQTCLQTIVLKFPSSIHGRMPEHGQFPMHLQPVPHSSLLVTCNDYIGMMKLGKGAEPTSVMPLTHDTQLCCAIYNQFFKQVVTGCDSSCIAVWDIETGNKAIVFSNAHGEEEITTMVFDETWRRLITGARNGSIKVWNFQNGHNLHKLEAADDAEVTGILPILDKRVIMAIGWSQQITLYDDSDGDNMYVSANSDWKGGQLHKEDILAIDKCSPNFIATGSFDGEIIIWDIETEKLFVRLRKGQPPDLSGKIEDLTSEPSSASTSTKSTGTRPNSRHKKSHKLSKGQPAPVDKLLFLKARAAAGARYADGAILVSSEAGVLRFWSIYGQKKEIGYFYVPDNEDESVLTMCTPASNTILVTGDTQGNIKIWNITDYCIKPQEKTIKSKPMLVSSWRAHDGTVVSVDYLEHEDGVFILSASTDKTARLWSTDGRYVGTFGQKQSWNLKHPSTWMHPKTPWSILEEQTEEEEEETHSTINRQETTITEVETIPEFDEVALPGEMENGDKVPNEIDASQGKTEIRPQTFNVSTKPRVKISEFPRDQRLRYRSQTFPTGFNRTDPSKTFLGIKVERDFARKQQDRKGRRDHYGGINFQETSRFGKLCSPFQALQTPELRAIQMPKNLPLSDRMLSKGYTSDNLTQEQLKTMDFSLVRPDSSLYGADEPLVKKTSSRRPSEDKQAGKLPPIKSGRWSRLSSMNITKKTAALT